MKKRVKPKEAAGILRRVPSQSSFWLCTNQELRNLEELSEALDDVDDDVFRYHANRDKNDFEVWIRDIVQDKELAREISRIKTKGTLIRKIEERIEELKKIVKRSRGSIKVKKKKVSVRKKAKKKVKKKSPKKKAKKKKAKKVSSRKKAKKKVKKKKPAKRKKKR